MGVIQNLEALLATGQDNALLRYGLGSAYLKEGQATQAVAHLARALELEPLHSAAWKAYGKALADAGRLPEAAHAYEQGIRVAEGRGDVQAAKEMRVFLNRVRKALAGTGSNR
ncbi:MAG: hypothetical protein B7Z66_02440 [Chromatiales bacterium 21-64-14]|nr:MAG: hypothetical protein B7Z66_02440 [Chromatiales bacterium 21-64-14]HQU14480.1 tetratricopeptide repeat protein [Gammaproteobacteria bacterium]